MTLAFTSKGRESSKQKCTGYASPVGDVEILLLLDFPWLSNCRGVLRLGEGIHKLWRRSLSYISFRKNLVAKS